MMPQKKQGPKEPKKEERKDHELTHVPFRSWCRHRVRERGKEEACIQFEIDPAVAYIHLEFMFMGKE